MGVICNYLKTTTLILILSIFVIFLNCKKKTLSEIKNDNEYYEFSIEKSPNAEFSIYHYCRSGGFAFSNDICNTYLLKSSQNYKENNGFKIDGKIEKWISNDTLLISRFMENESITKDTLTKITYEKYENLNIKIKNHNQINSGVRFEYYFDQFEIKDNKITFKNVVKEFGPELSSYTFDLGGISASKKDGKLNRFVLSKVEKSMTFKVLQSNGKYKENLAEIKIVEFNFIPKNKIEYEKISNLNQIFVEL